MGISAQANFEVAYLVDGGVDGHISVLPLLVNLGANV